MASVAVIPGHSSDSKGAVAVDGFESVSRHFSSTHWRVSGHATPEAPVRSAGRWPRRSKTASGDRRVRCYADFLSTLHGRVLTRRRGQS